MHYNVTHLCGHTASYNLFGKTAEREDRIRWLSGQPCQECRRKEELASALKWKEERGLGDLDGTPKQVEWAEKIRKERLSDMEKAINDAGERLARIRTSADAERIRGFEREMEEHRNILQAAYAETSAKFWIDHRDDLTGELFKRFEVHTRVAEPQETEKLLAQPEEILHSGTAVVKLEGSTASFHYPKDSTFIEIMHEMHCRWKDSWQKKEGVTGKVEDLAAEVGHALLKAGFVVEFPDESIREAAVTGTFKPALTKWVEVVKPLLTDKLPTQVAFKWLERDTDFYSKTKSLPATKWDSNNYRMMVPAKYYQQIEDFAELNGFVIKLEAQEVLDRFRAQVEGAPVVVPKETPKEPTEAEKLQAILRSSTEVIPDLQED